MKRQLFETVKVFPYVTEAAFDRQGCLSAVLGVLFDDEEIEPGTVAVVTVLHCDTADGTFEPVTDERLFMDNTTVECDSKGKITGVSAEIPLEGSGLLNLDIDLLGCKRFVKVQVKFIVSDGEADMSAAYAIALGDSNINPPV